MSQRDYTTIPRPRTTPYAHLIPTWAKGVKCPYCLSRVYPETRVSTCPICGAEFSLPEWAQL